MKKKTAIINANSFAKYYPEFITELEQKVGEVTRFKFPADISATELAEKLKGYSYLIAGTSPQFTEEFFRSASGVKYVARFGTGYNNVDVTAARKHHVLVSNIPGYLEREDVAEQAVALVLALNKHVVDGGAAVHNDEWNKDRGRFLGHRLSGRTVGVLGYGNIGSTFGKIMSRGFGCRVLAYDPFLSEEQIRERGAEKREMDQVLSQADIISIHVNLTPESYHLISTEKLKLVKPDAILINTARGELVDETAVAEALEAGTLGGYGADVSEMEPIRTDHPLLRTNKCVLTPHLATYNWECNRFMCQSVTNDIIAVSQGKEPSVVLKG